MELQIPHHVIRTTTGIAAKSFFTSIHTIGGEDCPKDIPIIVTATHHNMMLDPVILSHTFPHRRILNYWSKATLFINPVVSWILYSSGNIPVDRKSKDRKVLLKGTLEALKKGYAVALFPEGTSYTEPRIMQVKDGAAWAALEYTRLVREHPELKLKPVAIVPAAIVYTNKTKYRSSVISHFGSPIYMDSFTEEFFSDAEGAARSAVKKLTRQVEKEIVEKTINAPDWNTLYCARMARDILWIDERSINLNEYVAISQTLVDLFSTEDPTPNFKSVKRRLLEYYSLLQSTNLTHSVLSNLPLPRTLDPNRPTPLPNRLLTLLILLRDTFLMLLRLPFFVFPLVMYLPVYYMGRVGARLVKDEEETQAQNKLVFGMISMFLTYPTAFFFLWSLFLYTRVGAVMAAATLWLFARYHDTMINANYESAKRLLATWRVLIALWGPKRWDLTLPALTPYMTPVFPKESLFLTNKTKMEDVEPPADLPPSTPGPRRRPSSRSIMRHVLRARGQAVTALAELFEQLRMNKDVRLKASEHLVRRFGGQLEEVAGKSDTEGEGHAQGTPKMEGRRQANEVIAFLTKRGAKFPHLGRRLLESEAEWAAAALTSDAE
uniref:Phospholipid/glycerol acyltransferase domain-containing protein n=1 Tax=Mycena chlorophos TaxID=658473 RepID=A0ABQ0M2D9_MYCCL|nr:predicted protein [Mycena chlorophos]